MPRSEGSELRIRGVKLVQQFIDQKIADKANGVPISGNEPKMAKRGLRSLMLTPERYSELLEKAMTEGWTGEKLKNALRGKMEKEFPKTQRVLETDRIHHASAPDMWTKVIERSMKAGRPELVIDAVDQANKEGLRLGDTHESTAGASFDERAHTGARPKASKTKYIAPMEHGVDGDKEFSAHPRGTKADKQLVITDKSYDSSKDLLDDARPKIELANQDTQRGIKADQTRRNFINSNSVKQGWIPEGTDVFGKNVTAKDVKAVRDGFAKNLDLTINAAKSFDPKAFFNSGLGFAAGAVLDPEAMEKVTKGDLQGGGSQLLQSGLKGEAISRVIGKGLEIAGPKLGAVSKVLPYAGPASTVAAGTATANTILKTATGDGYVDTLKKVQDKGRTKKINAEHVANTQQLNINRQQNFGDTITNVIQKGAQSLLSIFQQ